MDYEKAHSILLSKGVIDVEYDGKPIWIKTLNQSNQSVEIAFLDESLDSKVVAIKDLKESRKL